MALHGQSSLRHISMLYGYISTTSGSEVRLIMNENHDKHEMGIDVFAI